MYNFNNKTIREIALESPSTIRVFENHKIDFCCGGRIPFTEACKKAGADPLAVLTELDLAMRSSPDAFAQPTERRSAAELIAYIVDTHHAFTRSEIARLRPLSEKVLSRHGDTHPELSRIDSIFNTLADELLAHMRKEEVMLFPYIERLENAAASASVPQMPPFGTVNNPVRVMMFEHDQAGDMLRELRSLTNDYMAPDGACPSYLGLYAGLEDLEKDLHKHIHLENNILFPNAIEMEKQIYAPANASAAC